MRCKLVVEYTINCLISDHFQSFDGMTKEVLLSSSLSTSGTRMISYTGSQGNQMECKISGCTIEGWFSDSYAIPPIFHTCDMGLQISCKYLL